MLRLLRVSLLSMLLILMMSGISFCGECLQSDEEMYRDMAEGYKAAINGEEYSGGGWSPTQCWQGSNPVLNEKLDVLVRKIIKDESLAPIHKFESVIILNFNEGWDSDKKLYVNIQHVLKYMIRNNESEWKKALQFLCIHYNDYEFYIDIYNNENLNDLKDEIVWIVMEFVKQNDEKWLSIFKKQSREEDNKKTRHALLEIVRRYAKLSIQEYTDYIIENNYTDDLTLLINSGSKFDSLLYVFNRLGLDNALLENLSQEEYVEHFRWSSTLYNILRRNIHEIFPDYILTRLRPQELRLLRNGIFAYYGRDFKSKPLQYYYYGEPGQSGAVERFRNANTYGSKETRKHKFKADKLTDVDKKNIESIRVVEKIVRGVDYDFGEFVENRDLPKFLSGDADNLTLSPAQLGRVRQVRLDWPNKRIWIWEDRGVSGWDLKSGRRFHFSEGAGGPISLRRNCFSTNQDSTSNAFAIFRLNKKLVEVSGNNVQSEFGTFRESENGQPNRVLNVFSPCGRFFIRCTEDGVFVENLQDGSNKFVELQRLVLDNLSSHHTRTYDFSPDGKHLYIMEDTSNIPPSGPNFVVIPLEKPDEIKFIPFPYYKYNKTVGAKISLDEKGEYLYVDQGGEIPVLIFSINEIISNNKFGEPFRAISSNLKSYDRTVFSIYYHDDKLVRVQPRKFGYIDLSGDTKEKTTNLIDYGIPDFDFTEGVYAAGYRGGYIILRRLPF